MGLLNWKVFVCFFRNCDVKLVRVPNSLPSVLKNKVLLGLEVLNWHYFGTFA